jgi:hypothetical protein
LNKSNALAIGKNGLKFETNEELKKVKSLMPLLADYIQDASASHRALWLAFPQLPLNVSS